jgi:hypothetical protein
MKSADPHFARDVSDKVCHAMTHFVGSLIGERNCQDVHGVHACSN